MINIGILGCAEIADRRFMPEAMEISGLRVLAAAEEYDSARLGPFCRKYGLEEEGNFTELLQRKDINAVYIPQPPALHFSWAQRALEAGKHVLVEKPATTEYRLAARLVQLAADKNLALHENYMFQYHSQMEEINGMISRGVIGELRLARADFGFPLRKKNDFRYSRDAGGGALLDAGGYALKLASLLLGRSVKVDTSQLNGLPGYEVDMYGSASLSNDQGQVCQIGFGMDCCYRCSLELWGSTGKITAERIFTAPPHCRPGIRIETAEGTKIVELQADSHFKHSIEAFLTETADIEKRKKMYEEILLQAKLADAVRGSF